MSVTNDVFRVAWTIARGTTPTHPALKRQSSLISEAYDVAFYVHVQRLGERCRTAEDWERLLALLLGISLDPSMDTTPVWAFELAPNPAAAHGLRAASPSTRGRLVGRSRPHASSLGDSGGGGLHARERHDAYVAREAERRARRARLQELIEGAHEAYAGEQADLTSWVLADADTVMADAKAERETFAEEVHAWMRRLMGEVRVLDASKESKEAAFAAEAVVSADEVDVDELRAGKGADAAAIGRAPTSRGASADGGGGGDGAASSTALVGGKEVAQLLAAVDEAERAKNLRALGDLLRPQWEEVAVRAALALASLTAQDEAMQERLAAEGALPKIVGLFDRGFSEKGVLDLTLVVKSLSANCAHHPVLLEQFIGAAGAKKVVSLLSGSPVGALGSGEGQRLTAALEIVRSLSGVKLAREGLVEAGVVPKLLRVLGGQPLPRHAELAAAALAALAREDAACAKSLLKAGGAPILVQVLPRGGPAAVSSAAALRALAALGADAHTQLRDAGALEGLIPLLDSVYSAGGEGTVPEFASAEGAALALAALARGSRRAATEQRELGVLQTLLGIIALDPVPPPILAAACEALEAAAAADGEACREILRLSGVPRLVRVLDSGVADAAAYASVALGLLAERSDPTLQKQVADGLKRGGLPQLVQQLRSPTADVARRAALLLDTIALRHPGARQLALDLGAVPPLVGMLRKNDEGSSDDALNALGALDAMAQGLTSVQDAARAEGVFKPLSRILSNDTLSKEVRVNAALAAASLADGNAASASAAKTAGIVESLVRLLDAGAESELSVLAVMALKAVGLKDRVAQEAAVRSFRLMAPRTTGGPADGHRLATLTAVWVMETFASPARRAARARSSREREK